MHFWYIKFSLTVVNLLVVERSKVCFNRRQYFLYDVVVVFAIIILVLLVPVANKVVFWAALLSLLLCRFARSSQIEHRPVAPSIAFELK
jgi:hypothetical protein